MVSKSDDLDFSKEPIKVKISGDGARMTRNSSFILLSFSLLQGGEDIMSGKGCHTIAVVKGSENYETLKESFGEIFKEINEIGRASCRERV